jgi:hypothetical protein
LAYQYLFGPASKLQRFNASTVISLAILAAVATVVGERFPSLDAKRFTPKSLDQKRKRT